jgi:hypothetical protein
MQNLSKTLSSEYSGVKSNEVIAAVSLTEIPVQASPKRLSKRAGGKNP